MNPNKTLICLYLICFSLLILASCEKDEENDYGEKLLSFFTQNRILLSIVKFFFFFFLLLISLNLYLTKV